nr:flavonoid 3'-monooxygenase-like [Ziziphus jujuba var. spinosa]
MDFIYTDFTFKYAPWPAYCLFNITTKATFNSMEISCWDVLALSCFAALAFLFKLVTLLRSGGSNKFPPGPKPWPIIGNMNLIRPLPHRSFHKLSQKYGPLMQLKLGSVPVVIVASAEMAKQFLKDHDHIFATRPQTAAGKYTGRNYSSFLWAPYGPQWRLWRKICQSELFSSKRLDSYEYIRMEEMKALMSSLYASLGKPIVLEKKLSCFTFSLMSRIVLGKRYFNDSRYNKSTLHVEEFKKMAQEFMKLHGAFNIGDWIPWLEFFDLQGYVRRMKTLVKNFDQFFDFVYDEHKVNREREKDFFEPRNMAGLLLELMDDPNLDVKLTYDSVKALTQDLMVGGIETTSSTLEWAVSELIKHPHLIEKATEELDKVVGRERWVEEKDIPQLPYIDAIMKETMRKHPPSAMLPPHAALEDCEIGGFHIQQGSVVLVNTWSLGRDSRFWDCPEEFRPERFLGKEIDVKGNSFELIPFGSGRRICPGYNLALKTVSCGLANLLHGFKWRLPENIKTEDLSMEEGCGVSAPRKVPLVAVLDRRLPINLYQNVC